MAQWVNSRPRTVHQWGAGVEVLVAPLGKHAQVPAARWQADPGANWGFWLLSAPGPVTVAIWGANKQMGALFL